LLSEKGGKNFKKKKKKRIVNGDLLQTLCDGMIVEKIKRFKNKNNQLVLYEQTKVNLEPNFTVQDSKKSACFLIQQKMIFLLRLSGIIKFIFDC